MDLSIPRLGRRSEGLVRREERRHLVSRRGCLTGLYPKSAADLKYFGMYVHYRTRTYTIPVIATSRFMYSALCLIFQNPCSV